MSASFIPVYASLVGTGRFQGSRSRGRRRRRAPGADDRRARGGRRRWRAGAHRGDRAGLQRRQARVDHPDRPRAVSGRRAAGAVGMVPGRPEQPPAVPPVVCRAGDVERGDDRDARRLRRVDAAAAPGRPARVGIGGGQRPSVRGAASSGPARGPGSAVRDRPHVGSCPAGGHELRARVRRAGRRPDQRVRGHAHREPAADRSRDGPGERPAPVHAAGQPVRDVRRRRGAAGDGRRGRSRRFGARRASPAAPGRTAPHRVLRGAIGDRVPGVWRRDRGRAAADRPIPQRGRRLRLGHSRGVGAGPSRVHARPAVLVGLLRAARYAHAAGLCHRSHFRLDRSSATSLPSTLQWRSVFRDCGERPA